MSTYIIISTVIFICLLDLARMQVGHTQWRADREIKYQRWARTQERRYGVEKPETSEEFYESKIPKNVLMFLFKQD